MIDFYLSVVDNSPFQIELGNGDIIELPNMNNLTWTQLKDMIYFLNQGNLLFLREYIPKKTLVTFSIKQQNELFLEWARTSGIDLNELYTFFEVLKDNSRELEYSLRKYTEIQGVLGLLKLKPFEVLDVFIELIKEANSPINRALGSKNLSPESELLVILTEVLAGVNGNKHWRHPIRETDTINREYSSNASNIDLTPEEVEQLLEERGKVLNGK